METIHVRTVLLLEEEAITALDVEMALAAARMGRIVTVSSRGEAIAWLADHTPDIAVIDVRLKDGSCADVANLLNDRHVPFVVHTAWSRELGDNDQVFSQKEWVEKPSHPMHLITALNQNLHHLAL